MGWRCHLCFSGELATRFRQLYRTGNKLQTSSHMTYVHHQTGSFPGWPRALGHLPSSATRNPSWMRAALSLQSPAGYEAASTGIHTYQSCLIIIVNRYQSIWYVILMEDVISRESCYTGMIEIQMSVYKSHMICRVSIRSMDFSLSVVHRAHQYCCPMVVPWKH